MTSYQLNRLYPYYIYSGYWVHFPNDTAYESANRGRLFTVLLEFCFLGVCLLFITLHEKNKSCNSCNLNPEFFRVQQEFNSVYNGKNTAPQAGRSRVGFPMVSSEFFIDIILPAA